VSGLHRVAVAAVAPPPVDTHNALAVLLSAEMGVAPDLGAHAELAQPLIFGPMLPPRYRIDGPGARPDAVPLFSA
jgi:dimethylaniline monooxygenase (N-oxide forming)